MYICQLGDGLMLSRYDKYFRIENTGYPYPTIEYNNKIKSQSKLLYSILNDIDLDWERTVDFSPVSYKVFDKEQCYTKICRLLKSCIKFNFIKLNEDFLLENILELFFDKVFNRDLRSLVNSNMQRCYMILTKRDEEKYEKYKKHFIVEDILTMDLSLVYEFDNTDDDKTILKDDYYVDVYLSERVTYNDEDIEVIYIDDYKPLRIHKQGLRQTFLTLLYSVYIEGFVRHSSHSFKKLIESYKDFTKVSEEFVDYGILCLNSEKYKPYAKLFFDSEICTDIWTIDETKYQTKNKLNKQIIAALVIYYTIKLDIYGLDAYNIYKDYVIFKPIVSKDLVGFDVAIKNDIFDNNEIRTLLLELNKVFEVFSYYYHVETGRIELIKEDISINKKKTFMLWLKKLMGIVNNKTLYKFSLTMNNVVILYKELFNIDLDIATETRKQVLEGSNISTLYKYFLQIFKNQNNISNTLELNMNSNINSLLTVLENTLGIIMNFDSMAQYYMVYVKKFILEGYSIEEQYSYYLYFIKKYIKEICYYCLRYNALQYYSLIDTGKLNVIKYVLRDLINLFTGKVTVDNIKIVEFEEIELYTKSSNIIAHEEGSCVFDRIVFDINYNKEGI